MEPFTLLEKITIDKNINYFFNFFIVFFKGGGRERKPSKLDKSYQMIKLFVCFLITG